MLLWGLQVRERQLSVVSCSISSRPAALQYARIVRMSIRTLKFAAASEGNHSHGHQRAFAGDTTSVGGGCSLAVYVVL